MNKKNFHPYLEPLLLYLKNNEVLREHFTEKDFFRAIGDIDKSFDELYKSNCLDIKSLWVAPFNGSAIDPGSEACSSMRRSNFQILINIPCGIGAFAWEKKQDGSAGLIGAFMDLSHLMMDVVDQVLLFQFKVPGTAYSDLNFSGEKVISPTKDRNFFTAILDFNITVY